MHTRAGFPVPESHHRSAFDELDCHDSEPLIFRPQFCPPMVRKRADPVLQAAVAYEAHAATRSGNACWWWRSQLTNARSSEPGQASQDSSADLGPSHWEKASAAFIRSTLEAITMSICKSFKSGLCSLLHDYFHCLPNCHAILQNCIYL